MRTKFAFAGLFVLVAMVAAAWFHRAPLVKAQSTSAAVYTAHSSQSGSLVPVVQRRYYRRRPRRRVVVVRRRPFSHSATIVGGSALAGAGIGALAGGGKGAVAGGLVGGAGGLIYDRATHKKRRVVRR